MLEAYFFVPAHKWKYFEKAFILKPDHLIFDMEDAVSPLDGEVSFDNLKKLEIKENFWVRPRLFDLHTNELDLALWQSLCKLGFRNFVLPKLQEIKEFESIRDFLRANYPGEHFSFILLVESPKGLLNFQKIVEEQLINLIGVGLGSHDYCNEMSMTHTAEHLQYAKSHMLTVAKAYGLQTIDIASMQLEEPESFAKEIGQAFRHGFDAKFIIHPDQLKTLQTFEYFTPEEVKEALKVYDQIKDIDLRDFGVVKIDGKLYERPHIKRIFQIVNWYKEYAAK